MLWSTGGAVWVNVWKDRHEAVFWGVGGEQSGFWIIVQSRKDLLSLPGGERVSDTQVTVVWTRSGPGELQLCSGPLACTPCEPVCFACAAGAPLPAEFHLKGTCSVLGTAQQVAFCLQKHTAAPDLSTDVMAGAEGVLRMFYSMLQVLAARGAESSESPKDWGTRGGHQELSCLMSPAGKRKGEWFIGWCKPL